MSAKPLLIFALPGTSILPRLKLLREKKRINQVAQNEDRHDQPDNVFQSHNHLLKTIAAADAQPRDYEKKHRGHDKYNVSHPSYS
jgi:hypothetical protein